MFVNIKRKRKAGFRTIKRWGRYEEDYAVFKEALDLEKRVITDSGTIENLYCVHGKLGLLASITDKCAPIKGQLLYNYTFDCGVNGWSFDTNYPATITDNGDGSLHLKADSNFGSLVPDINTPFPNDNYIIEIKVRNVVGIGKISVRNTAMNWFNSPSYNTDGIYTFEYNGDIKEIHVGANDDGTFEADYEYISLKKIN